MEILYQVFEKARLIRKPGQLVSPIVSSMEEFVMPLNSLFHYMPESNSDIGPRPDHIALRSTKKPIPVIQITQFVDPPSGPRQVAFDPNPIMRGYLERNRKYRRLMDIDKAPRDQRMIILANHSLAHNRYKYLRSKFSLYNRWMDQSATVLSKMNEFATATGRYQFVFIPVPDVVPSISRLEAGEEKLDQTTVNFFANDGARWLLELWKWLDAENRESIFDRIEEKNYGLVHFVLNDSGNWIAFNLKMLNSVLKTTADEWKRQVEAKEIDPSVVKKPSSVVFENKQVQKYLLKLNMLLMAGRSVSAIDGEAEITQALQTPTKSTEPAEQKATETNEDDEADDNDNEEVVVKKAESPVDSQTSSPSSGKDAIVQSSRALLEEAARIANKGREEDAAGDAISAEVDRLIDEQLAELEDIDARIAKAEEQEAKAEATRAGTVKDEEIPPLAEPDTRSYEDRIKDRCGELAQAGVLTASEYKRLTTLSEKYKTLKNPYDPKGKESLLEAIQITPEEIVVDLHNNIAPNALVVDDSMRNASVEQLSAKYIKHTLKKHMLKSILHIQNAGVIIDNIEVEQNHSILGTNEDFIVRAIPIEGAPTTWRFPVPHINEDGTYTANSTKYLMRQQKNDLPLRKVAPNKVAMTSYYGKFFMYRGRKVVNDYGLALTQEVQSLAADPANGRILDVKTANVFAMDKQAPRSVSALAKTIREMTVVANNKEVFKFFFDLNAIDKNYPKELVAKRIEEGFTPIALSDKNRVIYFEGDAFYIWNDKGIQELGELEDILGIDVERLPAEYAELKISGKYVPVGILLAYEHGLTELIRRLKVQVRRVPVGTRVNKQPDEVALVFDDETILFSKSNRLATLVLAGFREFRHSIKNYAVSEFDRKGVYQAVLDATGASARILREFKLAKDMFVDPMTHDVLVQMKLPTDFLGLLVKGTELLVDDMHRDEFDMSEMRIKGYERLAGAMYSEFVKTIRIHNSRAGRSRYPLDMKPFAIWQNLAQDSSVVVVNDINPIEHLKQNEEVTYSGTGGRSDKTMTLATRAYRETDKGVISEATKDSGTVGINTYMPPNPQLTNTLGMPVEHSEKDQSWNTLLSTSALCAPGATRDDAKRIGFISIQNSHSLSVVGQMENILQTGYEQIVPHRTGPLYAVTAKQGGKVTEVTDKAIRVQYEDGTEAGYPIGREFGMNAGMVIPHELVTPLKEGSKFGVGDVITYNSGYFKPNTLNPKQVSWCNGLYDTIALCETSDTIEDAGVISQELADRLMVHQSKLRQVVVRFDQHIHNLIKEGQEVDYDSLLCVIENEVTRDIDLYDDADLEALEALGSQAPRAKTSGKVERIEVYYFGDKEDMSPSLRKLADASDREIAKRKKALGEPVVTGQVHEGYKIRGKSLSFNTASIRIFTTGPEPAGVGDKLVFCSQLKSIVSKVISKPMIAQDGTKVNGRFSYTSVARRIVNSPEIMGTTIAVLMKGSELTVQAYDS